MKLLLLLPRCGLGSERLLQANRLLIEDFLHATLLLFGASLGIHFFTGSLPPYKKISMTSIFSIMRTGPRHKESTLHPYR